MKHKAPGILCMILGALMILSAIGLFMYNKQQDEEAGKKAEVLLPEVVNAIEKNEEEPLEENKEMTVKDVDGHDCIGYLTIPILGLELPVISEWSYPLLQIAPCRQFGSTKTDDLVLVGHNYQKHFGNLHSLKIGDIVQFVDMDGEVSSYGVDAVDVIAATDTKTVMYSDWDLILYTCTYGGQSRVMVGCSRLSKEQVEMLISQS